MTIEKTARETLTAVELDLGEVLTFRLRDGAVRTLVVETTSAVLHETTLKKEKTPEFGARTICRMKCQLRIDGHAVQLVRWVGSQRSFYEPWEFFGLRLWFDANTDLFQFLLENHGACKPRKRVRLALQDATQRVCPVLLHPWCPLPSGGLRIEDCYDGHDCWMGPYFGAEAHGGLDINHPAGTPLWAPFDFREHAMFDRVDRGASNNRWRGVHYWPDGAVWILEVAHVLRLLAREDEQIAAGTRYAEGAGMATGSHEHSHFVFKAREPGAAEGEEILLDPWILFWQTYRDRAGTLADVGAGRAGNGS